MALTSINADVINNPYAGRVDFSITSNVNVIGNIASLEIYRKKKGVLGLGNKIYKKTINDASDLEFDTYDICNRAKQDYIYTIQLIDASLNVLEYKGYEISSWFDGLFIGDYIKQYVAPYNSNTTYTQITQSNYVTTLSARTPYKVINANVNYASGNSSAMFLQLDNNNNPIPDYSGEYTEDILAYLTNGEDKILKTSRGEIWLVTIDQEVNVDPNDNYEGTRIISFNWTEIGDVPVLRTV